MVVALAGRRIDMLGAEKKHFPLANVARVRERISNWFEQHEVHTLVCSAACGADLLALEVAGRLGIRRCVILPFPQEQFRATSVVDRGGDWGERFDAILDVVKARGDLSILGHTLENETAYLETNHEILALATLRGAQLNQTVGAVVVWDGVSRGDDDVTAAFQKEACKSGLAMEEISTL
jgi:hypothetical protein